MTTLLFYTIAPHSKFSSLRNTVKKSHPQNKAALTFLQSTFSDLYGVSQQSNKLRRMGCWHPV
jgi:hypothetical protein